MGNIILRLYTTLKIWGTIILNKGLALLNKQSFILYLLVHDFFYNSDSRDMLRIMKKYAELSWRAKSKTLSLTNRSVQDSYALFCALVETYLDNHSEVTLQQLIEVLKIEIIEREKYSITEREKYGRK